MLKLLKKILLGPAMEHKADPIVTEHDLSDKIKSVWNDENEATYGINRVLRLFLIMIHILYPTVVINGLIRNLKPSLQRLVVDSYVFAKFIWLLLVIIFGWYQNLLAVIFTVYIISETVIYILSMIVLPELYKHSSKFSRIMVMLFFNYLQVALGFSIVYLYGDFLNKSLSRISAIYYSLVTLTTLGYGDYYPATKMGQIIVIIQIIILSLFVVLFINYFSPNTNE